MERGVAEFQYYNFKVTDVSSIKAESAVIV